MSMCDQRFQRIGSAVFLLGKKGHPCETNKQKIIRKSPEGVNHLL